MLMTVSEREPGLVPGSFWPRMAINRPKARQVPVTKAKAQTGDQTVKVDLDETEKAMMREMEKTLQKGKPNKRSPADARRPFAHTAPPGALSA
jgi:hypothetical protein